MIKIFKKLLIREYDGRGIIGVVHALLVEGRFLIDIGVDKPFVRRVKSVVDPAPAGRAAAEGVSVVGFIDVLILRKFGTTVLLIIITRSFIIKTSF